MTTLEFFSEPFARTGNISAEGFRNLLGRPAAGVLKTVIREAFQNSMDAARTGKPPRILLRVRTLTPEQQQILATRVFRELPDNSASRNVLSDAIARSGLRVMEICDFGTTGLGGPTRADAPADGPDEMDFVNFMRNVGAARDVHHGGGTYGYGKTSLYALSSCATILVDSETRAGDRPVRRLMGCHLGAAFDASGVDGLVRRHTGRHWWGVPDGEGGVDPAEEELASELVTALGFPARNRGDGGTSIMILDPMLPDEDGEDIGDEILETVLWNFWPRMTRGTPAHRRLDFVLEIEGESVEIPLPEQYPPLDRFATALEAVRNGGENVQEIRSQRPAKLLGKLAIRPGMRADRVGSSARGNSIIPKQSSHIALMRPVELVVRYVEGEAYPDRRYEWAGVFVCSDEDEVEKAFAASEPPAHDDWIPDMLPRSHARTWVNVATRRIREIATTHAVPGNAGASGGERGPSLAATAARMGRMLDRATPSGPGRRQSGSGGSKRKQLAVTQPHFVRLEQDADGRPVAIFNAVLTNDGSAPGLRLVAEPHLVMDGGATGTDDLPDGYTASVSNLALPGKDLRSDGDELQVGTESGEIEITVPMTDRAAVGVRLRLEGGDAQ